MDSSWTLRGLLMDSKGTASLIYLIKMNFNHYKNDCPERESNSEPFGHCKPTRQPAELTGHVHMALFRKYIMPTSRDTLRSINQPPVHPITNHNRIHHHHDPATTTTTIITTTIITTTTTSTTTSTATNNNAATTTQQQQRRQRQRQRRGGQRE